MRLAELAELLGAELRGSSDVDIARVATLAGAGPSDLSFLSNRRYHQYLADTNAGAVLLEEEFVDECPTAALVCKNPYLAYARAAACLNPPPPVEPGVHPRAAVDEDAELAEDCQVAPGAVIEPNARIGARTVIGPGCVVRSGARIGMDCVLRGNVTLCEDVVVGNRAVLHPGVVIGADGFGIALDGQGHWVKIPQLGSVRLGDDVEVGANTTIDRGALEDTVIGDGVKLDNLIQVAHNVRIGEHTAIAACVAIGGSSIIGAKCTIGGGSSIAGHVQICDNVHLTGTSAVPNSISRPGTYSSGMPIQDNKKWRRNVVRMGQLDDMARRVRALERELQALRGAANSST